MNMADTYKLDIAGGMTFDTLTNLYKFAYDALKPYKYQNVAFAIYQKKNGRWTKYGYVGDFRGAKAVSKKNDKGIMTLYQLLATGKLKLVTTVTINPDSPSDMALLKKFGLDRTWGKLEPGKSYWAIA